MWNIALVFNLAVFSKKRNEEMKRSKRLTRNQKECLSAHHLNAEKWRLVEEMEFYLKVVNVETGQTKILDKFRRVKDKYGKQLFK